MATSLAHEFTELSVKSNQLIEGFSSAISHLSTRQDGYAILSLKSVTYLTVSAVYYDNYNTIVLHKYVTQFGRKEKNWELRMRELGRRLSGWAMAFQWRTKKVERK